MWRPVSEAAVRPDVVVLLSILLDDDDGFAPRRKPLHVEAFVAKLSIEALVQAVLPRLAWRDVGRLDALFLQPILDGLGDELGTIVAADERRWTVQARQ